MSVAALALRFAPVAKSILIGVGIGSFLAWILKEDKMFDCSKEITKFYDEKVALSESMKSEMRDRRDANRNRLKNKLKKDGDLSEIGMWSQGSYAMHTMIKAEDNDFDIDDGVYFKKEDLKNENEFELDPHSIKSIIKDAVDHNSLESPPEIKSNCVRVNYKKGYHIDIPVYRTINYGEDGEYHELASSSGWKESDPRAVTEWFKKAVIEKSPDEKNGRQMRRIVRLLKDYVKKNAESYQEQPSGFMISKLVEEEYEPHEDRDDEALYYTMKNILDRLKDDLEVDHPVLEEKLTSGPYDQATSLFKTLLSTSIDELQILFETDKVAVALDAWGKVFNEEAFFADQVSLRSQLYGDEKASSPNVWTKSEGKVSSVDKRGGGRNA